jgi:hypothetical protein
MSFKIAPRNYLGLEWQRYKADLYALALSKPAVYATIRQNVLDKVKNDAIDKMYETFYNVLSEGKVAGADLITNRGTPFRPNYPEQEINSFCLSACKTLEAICDECIEILIPIDYNKILRSKFAEVGRMGGDETAPALPTPTP